MRTIVIYGQAGCSYCSKALLYVRAAQFPVEYRDIADPQNRSEMFERFPGATTVPQIFVGDRHIGGHDDLVAIPLFQLQQMVGGQ